jgi:prefoldin beta subunit
LRESIQQYEHKKNENEMVKNELNFLEDSDIVYKLIGPILVKQENDDAKMTVEKRLEFISKEM